MFSLDRVREVLARYDAGELVAALEQIVRPAIHIKATWAKREARRESPASRFGGLPEMPKRQRWPVKKGVPMEHVAQLSCADLAPFDPEGLLPKTGILAFFFSQELDDGPSSKKRCKVLYFDESSSLEVVEMPTVESTESDYDPCVYASSTRLAFSGFASVPVNDIELHWTDAMRAAWAETDERILRELSPLGPRPQPYRDHRMLGYVQQPDWCGVIQYGDVLLLTVDSQEPFQWGDCDPLHFVIKERELKNRDFSNVRVYSSLG